jgi:hypothetical protein
MGVESYNDDPALNTSIGGIDISEGCEAAGLNDAIRRIMADIKSWTVSYAVTYPISIANGGTGQATASAAFTAIAASGGTIGGAVQVNANLTRQGKGVHPYWGSTSATGGQMYLQASGSDPTVNPYDIVFEY